MPLKVKNTGFPMGGIYAETRNLSGKEDPNAISTCYGAARKSAREGRPGAFLPTAGQEGRDFLLNSCLIRLIHLLSLYREIYLTPKQGLLDP